MSSNAPYFIEASDLKKFPGPDRFPDEDEQPYPDLTHSNGSDSMYALADGAVQAHERSQFANLVQAAEAAHEINETASDAQKDVQAPRKRKRQDTNDSNPNDSQQSDSPTAAGSSQLSSAAAALFRKPSTTSKKYTRLPMGQLYLKLELAPERFLQLQSKAKSYMLDPEHTDRQATVGQRGKGDSELVKLRLWSCVKSFLEEEGNGAKFFGFNEKGENGAPRTMIWPQDQNAIISAVTPLMRRMVTNERQRQYAVETRKGGGESEAKIVKPGELAELGEPEGPGELEGSGSRSSDQVLAQEPSDTESIDKSYIFTPTSRALFRELTTEDIAKYRPALMYCGNYSVADPTLLAQIDAFSTQTRSLQPESVGILAVVDHHMRIKHKEGLDNSTTCDEECEAKLSRSFLSSTILREANTDGENNKQRLDDQSILAIMYAAIRVVRGAISHSATLTAEMNPETTLKIKPAETTPRSRIVVSVSHVCAASGSRLGPKREILADAVPYLHSVAQEGIAYAGPNALIRKPRVRVLLPNGLKVISDDTEWAAAVEEISDIEWLDGMVTVLVDYGSSIGGTRKTS